MTSAVVLNFFPAFSPASSGGEARFGQFYRALARSFNVTMLTSTDFGARYEEIQHNRNLMEIRFPKDHLWRAAYSTFERAGVQGELSGMAFALAVADPACALRIKARALAETADLVIHDFPFSEPIFSDGCPCPEIYNSHNFEISLLSAIVRGGALQDLSSKLIRLEGSLARRAQRVFAVSDDDAHKFRLFYGVEPEHLGVCPNGIDAGEMRLVLDMRRKRGERVERRPQLLFLGSQHQPNVDAAHFLTEIADQVPDCDLVLAGGVCNPLQTAKLPDNVRLLGIVDPVTKRELLATADLFLNPVTQGSGTSLKALEALASGLPMVSTPQGIRGIRVEDGVHCDVAPRPQFVAAIRRLLNDPERRDALSVSGSMLAFSDYSWEQIAATFAQRVRLPVPPPGPPSPIVLACNDYPVINAPSGGASRIRGLLDNIGTDVVLLTFGAGLDIALMSEGLLHVSVPKTAAHVAFESSINERQPMSVNDAVASLFAASNPLLSDLACALASRASAVVFEHPYMAPLLDVMATVRPDLPVVYSAHNVEATHKRAILSGHRAARVLTSFICELETRLTARAQLLICCTEADAQTFSTVSCPLLVVPNGCTLPATNHLDFLLRHRSPDGFVGCAGFLGSAHGPNVEAALFILRDLAPELPEVRFEILGSVCSAAADSCRALEIALPPNVYLHGEVSESRKSAIMSSWDMGLNPVESGGGSSLKLPDYMAHALASLSTPQGARGFAVREHGAGDVVERSLFADAVRRMLADPAGLKRQCADALDYAAGNLTWAAVTESYRESLGTLPPPGPPETGPRLLVVTYRYTEPALGGAEEYLVSVLRRLRPRLGKMDLAAVDIEQLTNQHHFGCLITQGTGGAARRVGHLFDVMRYFPPDRVGGPPDLVRIRDIERAWGREERQLLARFIPRLAAAGRLRLLDGFFGPENHHGVIRRWTHPEFSFLLPAGARVFRMSGYVATAKSLRMHVVHYDADGRQSGVAEISESILPNFSVSVAVSHSHAGYQVVRCTVDEQHAEGDHRPLGVLLEDASALVDESARPGEASRQDCCVLRERTADFSEQYEDELRTAEFDEWIEALKEVAKTRDDAVDADFAAVRGPHSAGMQNWLSEHGAEYDVVLVQGIPFDVLPSSVETLSRLGRRPRIVALPHFHGDDRFYHWRRYLESFSASDTTLLFSSSIAAHLAAAGRDLAIVPGGGVRSDEHGDAGAEARFRRVHTSSNPFFLVLGRKTGSKGYEQVVGAHRILRSAGVAVDLVLIGPDEDGLPIGGAGVAYLGGQPREVIRGALSSCTGLITMSRSESFGIVLCEAWLFGKPVIANRTCYAFRELVRDGENGLLADTETRLVNSMRRLLGSPALCRRLGRAGFRDAIAKYTWEAVAAACWNALAPPPGDAGAAPQFSEENSDAELEQL